MPFGVVTLRQGATGQLITLRYDRSTGESYILQGLNWVAITMPTKPDTSAGRPDFLVIEGHDGNLFALLTNQVSGESWYLEQITKSPPSWQFQHIEQPSSSSADRKGSKSKVVRKGEFV